MTARKTGEPFVTCDQWLARNADLLQKKREDLDAEDLMNLVYVFAEARRRLIAERRKVRLRDPKRYEDLGRRAGFFERLAESAKHDHLKFLRERWRGR